MLVPVSVSPVKNEKEHRYFDLFCARTGYEIMPSHDSGSIRQMLLQACYSDSSIKHAIVCLGALDKTAETTLEFSKLSLDNAAKSTRANEHHRFALEEYTKAVASMRTRGPMRDVRSTLLSVLLIFCFETWNGNMEMAVRQVHTGVRILQEWKSAFKDADMALEGKSPAPHIVEDDLITIFCRFVVQLSFLAATQTQPLRELYVTSRSRDFLNSMPKSFTEVPVAQRYHQAINRRITLLFAPFLANPPSPDSELAATYHPETKFTAERARHWIQAFEPLYKTFAAGYDTYEGRLVRTSKIQIIVIWIVVFNFFEEQTKFDEFNEHFAEIINIAEEAIAMPPVLGKRNPTNYSIGGRAISTLWITGIRCRDKLIRRKALALLLKYPRREGVWDSLFSAKMIEFMMELEEQYLEGDYIPGWARISALRWETDLEKRTAALSFEQRISPSSDEVVIRTKTINW